MKKLLLFVLLVGSVKIFSQENLIANEIVYDKVDKIAQYPGGFNAFRNNFAQTFNNRKINAKGVLKAEAQFVISTEGILTDIIIKGDNKALNKEMERTLREIAKTKWEPAEVNGEPVRYRLRFPIAMSFDN